MKKHRKLITLSGLAVIVILITILSYLNIFDRGVNESPDKKTVSTETEKDMYLPSNFRDMILSFSPRNGDMLSYRLTLKSDSDLSADIFSAGNSSGPSSSGDRFVRLSMVSSGDLFLKFYHSDTSGKDVNVSGVIENLKLTLNGRLPDYAKGMTYPFAFQMDSKGYINDFSFTLGIPEEAKAMIKNIFYTMQTVYPKKRFQTWKTREIDSTGQYQAEYSIPVTEETDTGFVVEKKKLAYMMLFNEDTTMARGLAPTEVRIGNSSIKTKVPAKGAWILSTDQSESTEIMSGLKKLGTSMTQFSAVRQDKTPAAAFAEKFEDAISALKSSSWLKEKYTVTDPELNAISANIDLNTALNTYKSMRTSDNTAERLQAEKFMINYLRQNPQACYDLIKLLDADRNKDNFDHETHLELWQLITKAGHEDAQRAVLEAVTNNDYSGLTHIRALAYIHDFEYPESFVAQGLWGFYKTVDMVNGDDASRELGTMSLYAIGSIGSEEKLNNELKPDIGKSLSENLTNACDTETQVVTLQAIGNYGGSDVIDTVKPYFTSESERVRAAAYEAIRQMNAEEAFDTFTESYEKESSKNVRTSALNILTSMTVTDKTISWAGEEVLKVEASDDQEALAKVLGQNVKSYPECEDTLRKLLDKKPSNNVKKMVYRYIAPE